MMNTRGFAILEIMLALALAAVLMSSLMFSRDREDKSRGVVQNQASFNRVTEVVRLYVAEPGTVRNSLNRPRNEALTACLTWGVRDDCATSVDFQNLDLYGPLYSAAATVDDIVLRSEDVPPTPVIPPAGRSRFDLNGAPCGWRAGTGDLGPSPACPFEGFVKFRVQCPYPAQIPPATAPAARCDVAEIVELQYTVQIARDLSAKDRQALGEFGPNVGMVSTQTKYVTGMVDPGTSSPPDLALRWLSWGGSDGQLIPVPSPTVAPSATPPRLRAACPGATLATPDERYCLCPAGLTLVHPDQGLCLAYPPAPSPSPSP